MLAARGTAYRRLELASGDCVELGNLGRHANRKGTSREKVRPKVEMGVQGAEMLVVVMKCRNGYGAKGHPC